jgi:hypothetical protein
MGRCVVELVDDEVERLARVPPDDVVGTVGVDDIDVVVGAEPIYQRRCRVERRRSAGGRRGAQPREFWPLRRRRRGGHAD